MIGPSSTTTTTASAAAAALDGGTGGQKNTIRVHIEVVNVHPARDFRRHLHETDESLQLLI